jgi:two-component system, OmpR family, KDP operon response regulator KdpE
MSKNASRSDPTTKVLVVDDEIEIRRFLRIGLEAYGYKVIEARNGEAALQQAVLEAPSLMILDLGLPDMEGHEVVKQVRDWSQMPIVVLSVRSEVGDKIRALDAGANDYVVKPFDIRELMARVRSQLRERPTGRGEAVFESEGLRIDFSGRTVTLDGVPVHLTKKEFELLALLVQHAGRVVTHKQIQEKLWGPTHAEAPQYLRVYVRQVREKLKDSSAAPRFLITVPGVGYRFKD